MWFVSKKKYNEMVAERDKWDDIASRAVAQNGRLLAQVDKTIEEMEGIQDLNHQLVRRNDDLLTRVKELETELQETRQYSQQREDDFEELRLKFKFALQQRDYYYDLLENNSEFMEGKAISREAE